MGERVAVIGHGGREHALAHKLSYGSSESRIRDVVVIGGNGGLLKDFECIKPNNDSHENIIRICKRLAPDLVVIGPEGYLAEGLVDQLRDAGITTFGPTKAAARLEASKYFAKQICDDAKILTARFKHFYDLSTAEHFVETYPREHLVVKVDSLCAGKGVTVCTSKQEALRVLQKLYLEDGFRRLGTKDCSVVIEEFLPGAEVSVFGVAHNTEVELFCPLQDYKRLNDADLGPNTGGMGACGPLGIDIDERQQFLERVREQIFLPVLTAMHKRGQPFSGLLYAGLMLVEKQSYLLEFNVRFGDPETQALMFGTRADIYPLLKTCAEGAPFDHAYWHRELLAMQPTVAIVMTSAGYPEKATPEATITLPSEPTADTHIFFAATKTCSSGALAAMNGRILSVVARAPAVASARALGYGLVRKIEFAGAHYRHDIGTHITKLN